MKKIAIGILILIVITGGGYYLFNHFVGAGVVGRIQYFEFNSPIQTLEDGINKVITANKELEKVNSDDYFDLTHPMSKAQEIPLYQDFKNSDAKSSYLSIIDSGDKYIFRYETHNKDGISRITLISAAEYGKGLDLAKNIGFFTKRKYQKIFEIHFISKVRQETTKN